MKAWMYTVLSVTRSWVMPLDRARQRPMKPSPLASQHGLQRCY